jgi:DNA-binding protein H-NS
MVASRAANVGTSIKSKVAVKYRNPKDPTQTWTGRGRPSNWLAEALKKGHKIENFKI